MWQHVSEKALIYGLFLLFCRYQAEGNMWLVWLWKIQQVFIVILISLTPVGYNPYRPGTCQVETSPGRVLNFPGLILASLCQ